MRIAVRDRGIGLPTDAEEAIFRPFGRAVQHQIPGSGTGLYLCPEIVERHAGRTGDLHAMG